jgi:hypothetical protein
VTKDGQLKMKTSRGQSRLLRWLGTGTAGLVLAGVGLGQVGALSSIANALGYGYEGDHAYGAVTEISGASMRIWAGGRGNLQARLAEREDNTFYSPQFDHGDAGFFVGVIDSQLPDPDPSLGQPSPDRKVFGPQLRAGDASDVFWVNAGKAPVTGAGTALDPFRQVTTYKGVLVGRELMTVTQTVTHISGQTSFAVEYAVQNTGAAPFTFRASAGADLYTEGDDYGVSTLMAGPPRFVGGANADVGLAAGIQEDPSTPFDHYQVASYSRIWNRIDNLRGAGFDDTLVERRVDNGVGVQWDRHVSTPLAAGATAVFKLTWRFAGPAPLSLTPPTAGLRVGDGHAVSVRATDSNGAPVAGRLARWAITGPNAAAGTVTTDANGTGVVTWPSSNAGEDVLVVYLDLDEDGERDAAEPQATAGAIFTAPDAPLPPVPPAPPAPPDTPTSRDRTPPRGTLPRSIELPRASALAKAGKLTGKITVNEPSTVRQALYLDNGRAPKAIASGRRARRKPVLFGQGTVNAKQAGTVKVTIKLTAKARKQLKSTRKRVKVVLLTELVDRAGNKTRLAAKRLTIR